MNPLAIDSIGIITPGAGDAGGSVGCIYVEARRFDDLPKVTTREISPTGAKTPIPDDVVGLDRLVQLGSRALWEAVDAELATAKIGLVVCAPAEADEPSLAGQTHVLLARLAAEAELTLAARASRVFASGRGAIFDALPFALAAVMQPEAAAVCILGVDSLVTKPRLKQVLQRGPILGSSLPGEAAAAVVLTRHQGANALALLVGLGMSREPSVAQGTQPNLGKGLLAAIDQAVAGAQLTHPVFSGSVHDMAGTAKEAEELAWAKTGQAFVASPQMESVFPYVSTGDAGAAMGILSLATSAFLIDRSAWSAAGLCCFASEEKRGAAILSPLPQATRQSRPRP